MSIGLFGGAFNPFHLGHIVLAREAQFRCRLTKVVFLPAGTPPHKEVKSIAGAQDRLRMIERSIKSFGSFETSSFEIDKKDISYTIDTVQHFRSSVANTEALFFLMGIDAFLELNTWRAYEQLLDYCNLVVTTRSALTWADLKHKSPIQLPDRTRYHKLHETITDPPKLQGALYFLEIPAIGISSQDIRQRIANGFPIDHLCPPAVVEYIQQHLLYQRRD